MTPLTQTDLSDLAQGACLLASGGGGPRTMISPLLDMLAKLPAPRIAAADDVGDDDLVVVLAGAGMPSSVTADSVGALSAAVTAAFERAEEKLGKISCIIPVEIGVANTLLPLVTAAAKNVPLMDAAGARRSLPSLTMTKLAQVPISPMVIATSAKSAMTINIEKTDAAEKVMMAIVSSSQPNSIGLVMWPMKGAVAKNSVSMGAITYTLKLGQVLRQAKESPTPNPVDAAEGYLRGGQLFTGVLQDMQHKTAQGFDVDIAIFTGGGKTFSIYSQNESLLAWNSISVVPAAMAPDLICYLTSAGDVYTNADIGVLKGKQTQVTVIGAPAAKDMETPDIVNAFLDALRPLGYGGPHVQLEYLKTIRPPEPRKGVSGPGVAPPPTAQVSLQGWRQQPRSMD